MSTSENDKVALMALSPDEELVSWFLNDLGAVEQSGTFETSFSGTSIVISTLSQGQDLKKSPADVAVALIRFVDVLSLKKLDDEIQYVRKQNRLPLALLVYRNENEKDFKMSCPFCGQKLWVRDADKDKRGRCPHCKKGFTLPDQEEHVAKVLGLSSSVQIHRVTKNDPGSLSSPVRGILELKKSAAALDGLDVKSSVHSKQTMNVDVDIPDDD